MCPAYPEFQASNSYGIEWPLTVMGLLPVVLVIAGFIPQYVEIISRKALLIARTSAKVTPDRGSQG